MKHTAPSVCLCVLRWGSWPAWMPLVLRQWMVQRTITFYLVTDQPPAILGSWPDNLRLLNISLTEMRKRLQRRLPPAQTGEPSVHVKRMSTSAHVVGSMGTSSKISDFKPMLGHVLADELRGCNFWGYLQEDVLIGDLRDFITDRVLQESDAISPLAPPKYNFGPFMIYRNVPDVTLLPFRSKQWRTVVNERKYLIFDEWWSSNISDHMPALIEREAHAGRLRAFAAADGKQQWVCDAFEYPEGKRIYNERASFSWKVEGGRAKLWAGTGSGSHDGQIADQSCASDGCCMPSSPPLALVHLHGIKHEPAFNVDHFAAEMLAIGSHAVEVVISTRGFFVRLEGEDAFTWFSGRHAKSVRVLKRDLDASVFAMSRLSFSVNRSLLRGASTLRETSLASRVDALQPCISSTGLTKSSCRGKCVKMLQGNVTQLHNSAASASCFFPSGAPGTTRHRSRLGLAPDRRYDQK